MKLAFYLIVFCFLFFGALIITAPSEKEIFIPTISSEPETHTIAPVLINPSPQAISTTSPLSTPETPPPSIKPAQTIEKEYSPPTVVVVARQQLAQSFIYKKGSESIVNFLCDQGDGKTTVATGVIISSTGYVATNAHVTDGLKGEKPTCTIRRGSPAQDYDTAQLVWMPKIYHATTSESVRARHDISIWKLKHNSQTPHFDFDYETEGKENETLLTLSYPAELLSAEIIFNGLNIVFSTTVITEIDSRIIKSRATLSAQHGSSGGVLIDPYTSLIRGIIFGVDTADSISDRTLFALSSNGINQAVLEDTQKTLTDFLAGNP